MKVGNYLRLICFGGRFGLYSFYRDVPSPLILTPPSQQDGTTPPPPGSPQVEVSSVEFLQLDLETIKLATNNFSDDNKLGEGGFGEVFKGSLLNGQDIAVKRLSTNSTQGVEEFKNEVVSMANLQHRNLVRLLGFCLEGEEEILVYEFIPNKSLDNFLFGRKMNIPFVEAIGDKVIDCAISAVGEQVGYILEYSKNFNDLDEKVKEVRQKAHGTKTRVEEDERRLGRRRHDYVKTWLDDANSFIEEAENRIYCPDRVNARLVCHPWSCVCTDLKLRRNLSKEAKEMVEDGEKLMKRRNEFNELSFHPRPDFPGTSYSEADIFKSRKKTMKEIMEAVKDPKIRKIGIYGLEGVGKTTLAKLVGSKAKQEKLFDVVVEAKVGESPDNEKIQQRIAESLGLKLEVESVTARADCIRKAIERETSVLVILEEVCTVIKLGELGIPDTTSSRKANNNLEGDNNSNVASATTTFMNSERGKFASSNADSVVCKILMTSGSEEKLREMGCETENNFLVEPLEPEEALRMFKDLAGLDAPGKDNEWQKIGKKIARKCEGLPALITTMATKLKHNDIAHWKAALTELSSNNTTGTMKHKIVHSALKLCTNEERRLLLLCGMKQSTCVSDLLKYGIGLGIFQKADNVEDARNILDRTISYLKASCLLFDDSTPEFVTMSNMIRDVSISIASSDHHYFVKKREDGDLKEWPRDGFLQIISLYVDCKDKLPQKPHCPKLEFFCLSPPYTTPSNIIPASFFEGMSNLKVVDLTHMVMQPSLPTSLASLNQLKTLCLDYCELEDMSGIGGLGNLEILSLLGFPMKQLPSEIRKLTKLRLLDLSNSEIEVIPPNVISNLVNLEELYMRNCSVKWRLENITAPEQHKSAASLSELGDLTKLTALEIQIQDPAMLPKDLNLQKLERYKIFVGEDESWFWFDKNKASRTLKLKLGLEHKHGLKPWLEALFEKVENLYLDEISSKISNVLYQLNAEGFRELKHLHIHNNSKIQYLVDNSKKRNKVEAFPNLETLELSNLSSLKKICNGPLAENSFNKLRVIKVGDCGQLQCLILPSMVKAFSQVVEIEVYDCNSLKNIALLERQDDMKIIEFTSLKSLTLNNLPQVDHFCSPELISSVPRPAMPPVTKSTPTSFLNSKLAFPSLQTLMLSSMNINKLWDDEVQTCDVAPSIGKLADLTVKNCGGLKYIFSPFMVQSFSNLKQLEIENCDTMEEIIKTTDGVASHDEVVFPKLKKITISNMKSLMAVWHYQFDKADTLEVQNCESLGNIFPSHRQTKFQNLKNLEVSQCNSLEVIFEMSSIINGGNGTTLLEELTLNELPNLKRIWSEDPQEIMSNTNYVHFSNLRVLCVTECEDLEYLFPSSIALDKKLRVETILISGALKMKELVVVSKKQAGPMDTLNFRFENLTFLVLSALPLLNTFYAGVHSLSCPKLKILGVGGCPNLKLFDDKLHHVSLPEHHHEHLFKAKEVIPNLEQLLVAYEEDNIIGYTHSEEVQLFDSEPKTLEVRDSSEEAIFPNWLLQHLYDRLETLIIIDSSFKKIFQDKREDIITLKMLTLKSLSHLEYICEEGSTLDPILEVLESLHVIECPKLTHLVPSCVTFGYLKQMKVKDCNGLIHLFASSTATSLVSLTYLKIKRCNALQQIVAEAAEETKDEFEVAFRSLKTLELQNLPSLNRFCYGMFILEFPSLEEVIVKQCPRLEVFSDKKTSAPKLQKVLLLADDERSLEIDHQDLEKFDGDLNCIIKEMLHPKSVEEENEGRGKECSRKISSSEENVGNPKADQIVETGTQMQKDQATRDLSPNMHSVQTMSEDAEFLDPKIVHGDKMLNQTTISVGVEGSTIGSSESNDLEIAHSEKMLSQTTISIEVEGRKKGPIPPLPPPAQGPEVVAKAYTSYKGMFDISVENLAYLMDGLERHPQVLEWLNTSKAQSERHRVYASSMFSLFADVTRLMRTTRRGELTEDDRNYIMQCCKSLESAGFDASWLSHVHGCLDKCCDGEMLKKTLEESETKAFALKALLKDLASLEDSLVLLRQRATMLHDFIES